MCAIFIVFFPLSLAANYLAKDFAADWWLPAARARDRRVS